MRLSKAKLEEMFEKKYGTRKRGGSGSSTDTETHDDSKLNVPNTQIERGATT